MSSQNLIGMVERYDISFDLVAEPSYSKNTGRHGISENRINGGVGVGI
jgi:hypothetical protein